MCAYVARLNGTSALDYQSRPQIIHVCWWGALSASLVCGRVGQDNKMASKNESSVAQPAEARAAAPNTATRDYAQLLLELSRRSVDWTLKCGDERYQDAMRENPHIAQVASYPLRSSTARDLRVRQLFTLQRTLTASAPTAEYRRRADELKTVNHWGQRKLLLSEIEFLTLHARPNDTVVYAGAAPGTHTEFLASLFPTLKFVLVDPADFVAKHKPPQIEVRQCFFTDDVAREFQGRDDVLFVCDIRTADWKVMNEEEVEGAVEADQLAQMKWHVLMKPRVSMLKFRLPWGKGETQYLDGLIYLPIWGPQTTTETRLIVRREAALRSYSHATYEAQMFAFNVGERVHLYARVRGLVECPGLCRCYDCSAEIMVVLNYFCAYRMHQFCTGGRIDKPRLWREITAFIDGLARMCSPQSGRSLSSAVSSEVRRGTWFGGRRFDLAQQKIVDVDNETTRRGVENKKRDRDRFERQGRSLTAEQLSADPALAQIVAESSAIQKRARVPEPARPVQGQDNADEPDKRA